MEDGLAVAREPRSSRPSGRRSPSPARRSSTATEGRARTPRRCRTTAPTRARRDRRPRTRSTSAPDRLDHARALVPEDGGTAGRRRPVDRVPVRVADAARVQSHEHLAGVGWRELQLGDLERRRRPGRERQPGRSSADGNLAGASAAARSSSIGMWQRIRWPGSTSARGGSSVSQIVPRKRGQRVWKTQPDGRIGRRGDLALELDPRALRAVDRRHRREERLRVRMVRRLEDRLRRPELHQRDRGRARRSDPRGSARRRGRG